MKLTKLNYVEEAENSIKTLVTKNKFGESEIRITTSKIRSILAMVSEVYNEVNHSKEDIMSEDLQERIQYLRMRIAYECGRERDVKFFVEKTKLLEHLKSIGDKKGNCILFCRYMEALVAYHKFYGGKD